MAKPKLSYFDFPGSRGEECRMALFLNGIDFDDNRIKQGGWAGLKPTTPFGAMPVLEMEGRPPLGQSNAILAYIGREFGHHPKDPWASARHEALFGAVEDFRHRVGPTGETKDEAEKKQRREAFAQGYLHDWAACLERQIEGPFIEGQQIHIADLKIFVIVDAIVKGSYDYIDESALGDFPKLRALHAAVSKHPKVVEWRAR